MQSSKQLHYAKKRRPNNRKKAHLALAFISSLVLAVILLSLLTQSHGEEKTTNGEKSSVNPPVNSYVMRIYTLNDTERVSTGIGTLFVFNSQCLPFEFGSLRFGDFREDTEYSSRYYAGMGLLASAEGCNATLTLLEGNGQLIQEIAYHGQSLIALGGWDSISGDNDGSVMDHSWGSMSIPAYDWRAGSWAPESGILIEHPANVTIAKVTIDLMVFEPTISTGIPEFTPVCASIVAAVLILSMRKRIAKQSSVDASWADA